MDSFATTRLFAERLRDDHRDELVALHRDPEVMRFVGGVRTPEATADYLARNLAHWARHGFGLWVLRTADGAFAGRAGIRHLDLDGVDEVDIAYCLARPLWGRGLASEIAAALAALADGRLGLPSLVGLAAIENRASRRVLEKSGFGFERPGTFQGDEVAVYRRQRVQPAAGPDDQSWDRLIARLENGVSLGGERFDCDSLYD